MFSPLFLLVPSRIESDLHRGSIIATSRRVVPLPPSNTGPPASKSNPIQILDPDAPSHAQIGVGTNKKRETVKSDEINSGYSRGENSRKRSRVFATDTMMDF
jgi:hypothetical protein